MPPLYRNGQKIELWSTVPIDFSSARLILTVNRPVIISITDIKTRAPGELAGEIFDRTGLRGILDDTEYQKHWDDSMYEDDTAYYDNTWTIQNDSGEVVPTQSEAWKVMNEVLKHNNNFPDHPITIVNPSRYEIKRISGEIEKCDEHGLYHFPWAKCEICITENAVSIPVT